jgi:hypothetical protein
MNPPEKIPIAVLPRTQVGIPWNKATGEFVLLKVVERHEVVPFRIASDVLDNVLECGTFVFFFAKYVIVRLLL